MFLRLWDQQDEIGGARAHCLMNLKGWIPDIAGHKKKVQNNTLQENQ